MTTPRDTQAPDRQPPADHGVYVFLGQHYRIDKALEIISATPDRPTQRLDVPGTARMLGLELSTQQVTEAGLVRLLCGDVDEDFALTRADTSVPVIMGDVAPTGEPAWMLLDGYHRLRRAYMEDQPTVPAYVLDREEVAQIRSSRF